MPPLDVRLSSAGDTDKRDPIEPGQYLIKIEDPPTPDLAEGLDALKGFLGNNNIFQDIEETTGLRPDLVEYSLEHSDRADWKDPNVILVNYARGERASLSMSHELVHIVLRQRDWASDEVISGFLDKHPDLSVEKRGRGYKIEQMIAYLVQRDLAKTLEKRHGNPEYGKWFPETKFEGILQREYKSDNRRKLGELIIEMWDEGRDPSEDIIQFARRVCVRYEEKGVS